MPEFKRYRDDNGAEFTQAVSAELAKKKGWTDITDDEHPAVDTNSRPLPTQPGERKIAAKAVKPTAAAATANTNQER